MFVAGESNRDGFSAFQCVYDLIAGGGGEEEALTALKTGGDDGVVGVVDCEGERVLVVVLVFADFDQQYVYVQACVVAVADKFEFHLAAEISRCDKKAARIELRAGGGDSFATPFGAAWRARRKKD